MPEDADHPYGHARIEYVTGLLISFLIIILGLQLFRSSVDVALHPSPLQFSWITLVTLAIAIGVKIWQSFFNISIGKRINSVALIATGIDSRNDVIATCAVLLSVIIEKLTDLHLDGIMGCLVALFIIWSGIQLIKETSSPLLGEAPDPEFVTALSKRIFEFPGVLGIHDLVVHNYGPGRIFASVHIEVDASSDLMDSHDMIDNIERTLSSELKIQLVGHMDPIRYNDPLTNKMNVLIRECLSSIEGVSSIHDLRVVSGPTHTNIIFDVVLSPECKTEESKIKELISNRVKEFNPNYYTVINFDKNYTTL